MKQPTPESAQGFAPRTGEPLEERAADGTLLHGHLWRPREFDRVVLYLHGLGSHGGWIEPLALALSKRGILTVAPDMRGHGRTGWELGEMPAVALLLQDAHHWADLTRTLGAGASMQILGTSLGGCLTVALGAEREDIEGIALISPSFRPSYMNQTEKLRIAVSLASGRDGSAATPLKRGLQVSGDPERLRERQADPLSLDFLSFQSHWHARGIITQARHSLSKIDVPILCVQGAKDPVVSPAANRSLFEGRQNTRFAWFADGYHDLALDRPLDPLIELLAGWFRDPDTSDE